VYLYHFNHSLSFPSAWGGGKYAICQRPNAVCHASELPFVFHTVSYAGYNFTSQEEILSKSIASYWTNFAVTGDPNKGAQSVTLPWPLYRGNIDTLLYLSTPQNSLLSNLRKEFCDLFDTIHYNTIKT